MNINLSREDFLVDFLELEKDEHLENCFRLENFLD